MKIATRPADVIKLCHAAVGSVVLLVSSMLELDDEPLLVCAKPAKGKRSARPKMSHGLYDDERELFLVSLRTGLSREMPNLSSRVIIFMEAEVSLGEETPRGSMSELTEDQRRIAVGAQAPARTAEECLMDFVSTFAPETGPERLCFERAKRHLQDTGHSLP